MCHGYYYDLDDGNTRSGTARGPRYPTNRRVLRAKLGLPPLRLPSSSSSSSGGGGGGGGAAAADRIAGGGGFVHAPVPDTSKADEVRRRLEDT